MKNTHLIASLSLSMVLATGQTATQSAYRGQGWVGLLVSASCDAGKMRPGAATREANLTTGARTTTPAVDDAGTRGSSSATSQDAKSADEKQVLPETGDVQARSKSSTDKGWEPARKQARALPPSCNVEANATKFALVLPDGSMLYFDDLANQQIAKRLATSPAGEKTGKVFRVSVQGKVQNGKIALDSIQL